MPLSDAEVQKVAAVGATLLREIDRRFGLLLRAENRNSQPSGNRTSAASEPSPTSSSEGANRDHPQKY